MSEVSAVDEDLPRAFGPYVLLRPFARGGMGEVFLAKSGGIAGLERTCVIKKLRAELSGDREYVTRFVDEARVVLTLNHANIAQVFDVGRVATPTRDDPVDQYYLAMEYVAGRDVSSLRDRCRKRGVPLSPALAVHIVGEALKALDYAHRRRHPVSGEPLNLVHRDVSPQNLLVSFEGEVKLIDFGLAASRLKVERTQPNVVMGKMAYMAPEQARGDAIDSRADLFACAVMLYELLTGERFYEGMTANDIWHIAGRGAFLPRAWSHLDPQLQTVLARALHPEATRRTPTCGELREQLLSFAARAPGGSPERALRELMEGAFIEEIERERAMIARFGGVTIASLQRAGDPVHSTLAGGGARPADARADDTVFDQGRPLLRASSPTTEAGGPPAALRDPPPPAGLHDPHEDPTRLQPRPTDAAPSTDRRGRPRGIHDERTVVTDPRAASLKALEDAATRTEATQQIRKRGAAAAREVSEPTDALADTTSIDVVKGGPPLLVAAAAVALVFVLLGVVIAGRDPPAPDAPVAPAPAPAAPSPVATMRIESPPPPTIAPAPPRALPAPPPAPVPALRPPPLPRAPAPPPTPAAPPPTALTTAGVQRWLKAAMRTSRAACVSPLFEAGAREGFNEAFVVRREAELRRCMRESGVPKEQP